MKIIVGIKIDTNELKKGGTGRMVGRAWVRWAIWVRTGGVRKFSFYLKRQTLSVTLNYSLNVLLALVSCWGGEYIHALMVCYKEDSNCEVPRYCVEGHLPSRQKDCIFKSSQHPWPLGPAGINRNLVFTSRNANCHECYSTKHNWSRKCHKL